MKDASYYTLAMVACALWGFIACAILDRAYGRIDIDNQETATKIARYYF